MSTCCRILSRFRHIEPAPLYLPWLNDSRSEHEAVIEEVLEPGQAWLVRYQASLWRACADRANTLVSTKDVVRVVGRHNLTLIIQSL